MNDGVPLVTAFGRRAGRGRLVTGDLVPRPSDTILARRRPGVVAGLWAWQTLLAVGVALPTVSFVCASYGACSAGETLLLQSDGRPLLDLLWRGARNLAALSTTTEIVLAVGLVVGVLPCAAAMIAIAYARRGGGSAGPLRSLVGAFRALPTMWVLGAVVTIAQGCLLGFGAGALTLIDGWLDASLGLARAQRLDMAVGLVFVLAASGFGVVHDLARAAVVRLDARAAQALALGAAAFGQNPLAVWWSWAWRALVGLVPAFACAAATTAVASRAGWTLVAIAVLHQSAVVSRAALRTSWLAFALRRVAPRT